MTVFNPFPGLRPFEPDEDHLFFGREKEIDELLRRLRSTRFLSVVGTSGSGKSSLVRSGLIPSLYSGFMVAAGSSWRVAMLRPGEDPIGHLAEALDQSGVLGTDDSELAGTNRVLVEATLRRGTLGLVDAVRHARIPARDNLLVVVDQFEELFRFRRSRLIDNSRDEAIAFVKLLLEATRQTALPIYVVLTMRSDFIGDCMEYPGLPEAVNNGQYLVPRMTRDEVRSAITGPVAVGGGEIAPRLVLRLLNELGDDQDQLPVLQHALMRTWDYWEHHHQPGEPDRRRRRTRRSARCARRCRSTRRRPIEETGGDRGRQIAERMFKALTDTFSDPRGVRRPTSVRELADICEATEAEVIEVVEIFRRPGRSFLMPPSVVPLGARSIIDLSHESLMRRWTRLVEWAEQDRLSASLYVRLSQAARLVRGRHGGTVAQSGARARPAVEARQPADAGLGPPARRVVRPRDGVPRSERAGAHSRRGGTGAGAEAEAPAGAVDRGRVRRAVPRRRASGVRGPAGKPPGHGRISGSPRTPWTRRCRRPASTRRAPAPTCRKWRSSGGELLEKAKVFYVDFLKQDARNEALRNEMAHGPSPTGPHRSMARERPTMRLANTSKPSGCSRAWRSSLPRPEYRQELANSYNWLGLTLTPLPDRAADAEKAYNSALSLQEDLVRANPSRADYRQELARTRYNRGILRCDDGHSRFVLSSARPSRISARRSGCSSRSPERHPIACPRSSSRARTTTSRTLLALDDDAARRGERTLRSRHSARRGADEGGTRQSRIQAGAGQVLQQPRPISCGSSATTISRRHAAGRRSISSTRWRCRRPRSASNRPTPTTCAASCCRARDPRAALAEYQEALEIFEKLWKDRSATTIRRFSTSGTTIFC